MSRLIKEGYVTEEMIDNFLYHNKIISSAKPCDPMKCDLNLNAMFKQIGGRKAFGTVLIGIGTQSGTVNKRKFLMMS